jgi:hypothetical protein
MRQRTKRASNCPVPSEISFDTFGLLSATATLLLQLFQVFSLPDSLADEMSNAERRKDERDEGWEMNGARNDECGMMSNEMSNE